MLTIFHTADWHLGQSFCGFDRDYEHRCFLDWLLQQLQDQQPDALIIAGDVFDTINPSAVAQQQFYRFLAAAHAGAPHLQIVVTAGNHDAGARLEAPADVLHSLNTRVVGTVAQDQHGNVDVEKFLVPLKDQAGDVQAIVMAVPFLRPADVPLVADAADPYLEGIRELYRQVTEAARQFRDQSCPEAALIAMGHCHFYGGKESADSERRLVIGGAEAIGPETFDHCIAYVALGHLHRVQQCDGGRIRYSGSPIPLSFSETHYEHQLLKLTFDGRDLNQVESMLIPRSTSLLQVPSAGAALIDDVLTELQSLKTDSALAADKYPFLEVRVLENGPDPTRRKRIEEALKNVPVRLASIKVDRVDNPTDGREATAEAPQADLKTISPEDIFRDAWQEEYNTDPDTAVMKAFREILMSEARD